MGIVLLFVLGAITVFLAIEIKNSRKLSSAQNKEHLPDAPTKPIAEPTVRFRYRRKNFIMSRTENAFFDTLIQAVDGKYYVFPQVHLSEILDHEVRGQDWTYAFRAINQKSVDYVICDRQFRRPLLAIELDDSSHNSESRRQRDINVEYMLKEAGMPLLRLQNGTKTPELYKKIAITLDL